MMKPKKISIAEIHDFYPSLIERGLSEIHVESLVEWDVIGGVPKDVNNDNGWVFKTPMDMFVRYQDHFYSLKMNVIKGANFIRIDDINTYYPSIIARGLSSEILELLVEWNVIGGVNSKKKDGFGSVFQDAIELFIKYHNELYTFRSNAVNENLNDFREKKRKRVNGIDEKTD